MYFVGLIAGLLGSVWVSPPLLARKGIGWTLAFACGLSSAAFLYLAFVSPPFSPWWRVAGLAVIGLSAGVLHTAIFHAISPMYRHDPAATVNLSRDIVRARMPDGGAAGFGNVLHLHGARRFRPGSR